MIGRSPPAASFREWNRGKRRRHMRITGGSNGSGRSTGQGPREGGRVVGAGPTGRRPRRLRQRVVSAWPRILLRVLLGISPASAVAQSPLDGPARLTVDSVTVEQALQELRRSAGVSLLYSPDLLPADLRVSCPCAHVTVREALARILANTGLTFRTTGTQIRIVPLPRPDRSRPETGVITGHVLALDTGEPVDNALVQIDDGPGTPSNEAGFFLVRAAGSGIHRLRVTSIGFVENGVDEVTIPSGDTVHVVIRLARAAIPLPSILVAPGTFNLLEDVSPGAGRSLTREEIQALPQLGEDLFRAMKRLPGVASSDISTKLTVRGGSDSEVLVRLDGLELYEPYHMKDWDGAVGIIDLNALGGVQLTTGGFGVEHGDRLAGVFDMRSRTSVGSARTTTGLSITNLTALSRGGLDGGNGAWLIAARRGFMGLLIKLIGEDDRLSPQYYDVFGKVSWQLSPANRLTAHVLWAGDRFGLHEVESNHLERIDLETGWDSNYGWLVWDAKPHPRVSASTMAWAGRVTRNRDGLVVDFGRPGMPDTISVTDDRLFSFAGLRHDLEVEISDRALLKVGADVRRLHGDYGYAGLTATPYLTPQGNPAMRNDRVAVDLDNHGTQVGAWLAARVRPIDPVTVEAGLRYDGATHTDDHNLAPRLLAAIAVGPRTTLRGSLGRYWQSQGIQQLEVSDGEVAYSPAERADQVALGIQHRLGNGIDLRSELYQRRVADQRPRFINLEQDLRIFPELEGDRTQIDPGRGRARGMELTVERREAGRWTWSAYYVLALAEDELRTRNGQPCPSDQGCSARAWVPRQYDQRHTVDLQAGYRPGRNWNVTLAWKYHSGWPATAWEYDLVTGANGQQSWVRAFGPIRSIRLPAYHRLDLRMTRDFRVRRGTMNVFVDLFNLYDRTNLASWRYEPSFIQGRPGTARHQGLTLLPRLPTFGLRYEF
ncbi:MAG: hypothetical protein FIB01_14930 [Gemmatimonadetes bacterium]|nr:hypothetical protein [Gemmatimonadota bacterium]